MNEIARDLDSFDPGAQRGPPEGPSNASSPRSRTYSSGSSRVGNGEGSTEPIPPRNPGVVGNDAAAGSGMPVVPVRLAPERARAALPVDPAAPVRRASVGVARAPVRPELLRPARPVLRFAAGRRFAVVRLAAGRRLAVVRLAAVFRFGAAFRLVAVLRFAVLRFAAVFRLGAAFRFVAVLRFAVLRFAAVFRLGAAFRFVAVLRFAVLRFAAVFRFGAAFRLVAVLRFAVVRFAVVRLAVDRFAVVRLAAGRRFAVDRFAAVRFVPVRFLVAICLLLLGEFGGNDSAQYALRIGRFHHPHDKFLRYLEIFSTTSPVCMADTCFAMSACATIPTSFPSSSTTGKRRT